MRDGIDNVALREASVPAGNMGREAGGVIESSVWRRDKKSFAVVRSPEEPARWALVAYCRAKDSALASLGMVLNSVQSENGNSHSGIETNKKSSSAFFPYSPCSAFPWRTKA